MAAGPRARGRGRDGEQPEADGAEVVEGKEEQPLVAVEGTGRHPAPALESALLDGVDLDQRAEPLEVEPDALSDEQELVLALGDHDPERPLVRRGRPVRTAVGLARSRRRGWRFADTGVEQHPAEEGARVAGDDVVAAEG